MYSLHVTINLPDDSEDEYDVDPMAMNENELINAIADIMKDSDGTSFVFVVVKRP